MPCEAKARPPIPRRAPRPRRRRGAARRLLARAPTGIRNRALLAVLFRSGLRISEALALLPKDLDPAGGSLRVLHGKGNKARTAPLPTDAADAVDRWLECRKRLRLTGRHPLFCTLKGEALWDSYVRALCKRLAAKAGIEKRVHPHGFRHGWALSQVENGTSLPVIQQLLGHSSLATTARVPTSPVTVWRFEYRTSEINGGHIALELRARRAGKKRGL